MSGQPAHAVEMPPSPCDVVQAQLDAYNAKNIEALLRTYAPDAEQFELHGRCVARGHAEIRARLEARFTESGLHAELVSRTCVVDIVVDHERISRTLASGIDRVDMLCIYEVADGRIRRASFAIREASRAEPAAGVQPDGSRTGQRPRGERAPDEPA